MSMKILLSTVLTLTLIACTEQKNMSFFDQTADVQQRQASEMNTGEVYRLYKLSFDMPPPPTYALLPVIGSRGKDALEVWIDDLQDSNSPLGEVWQYGPLLREVKNKTSVTICQNDKIFTKASTALSTANVIIRKEAEMTLREYC